MGARPRVTNADRLRLAAETCRDPRTIKAVLNGAASRNSREAVVEAAKRLDIKLPDDIDER